MREGQRMGRRWRGAFKQVGVRRGRPRRGAQSARVVPRGRGGRPEFALEGTPRSAVADVAGHGMLLIMLQLRLNEIVRSEKDLSCVNNMRL